MQFRVECPGSRPLGTFTLRWGVGTGYPIEEDADDGLQSLNLIQLVDGVGLEEVLPADKAGQHAEEGQAGHAGVYISVFPHFHPPGKVALHRLQCLQDHLVEEFFPQLGMKLGFIEEGAERFRFPRMVSRCFWRKKRRAAELSV